MTERHPHSPEQGRGIEPLFPLGQVLATPGALEECQQADRNPLAYVARHARGDWGDLGHEDVSANEQALEQGGRIFSAYTLPTSERLWVITEADRSVTTVLTPLEY